MQYTVVSSLDLAVIIDLWFPAKKSVTACKHCGNMGCWVSCSGIKIRAQVQQKILYLIKCNDGKQRIFKNQEIVTFLLPLSHTPYLFVCLFTNKPPLHLTFAILPFEISSLINWIFFLKSIHYKWRAFQFLPHKKVTNYKAQHKKFVPSYMMLLWCNC